jgi:hypothetical protein
MKRIFVALVASAAVLTFAPATANYQSFDGAEYSDATNGMTRGAVENECNCTGHLAVDGVWQGYAYRGASYTRLGGGEVVIIYRLDTDQKWRLKGKSWSRADGTTGGWNFYNNSIPWWCGPWIAGSKCPSDGGGSGGGGSW